MRYQGKTGQQHLLQDLNPLSSIPTLGSKAWPPPKKKIPQVCNWVSTALYYPIMIQKHLASPLNVPGFLHL